MLVFSQSCLQSSTNHNTEYGDNISSGLFAFSMLTIVSQSTPPSGDVPTGFKDQITPIPTLVVGSYVVLSVIGLSFELVACFTCVVWYIKVTAHCPTHQDIIFFIKHYNMAIPIVLMSTGILPIVISIACLIYANYGYTVGTCVSATSGPTIFIAAALHLLSLKAKQRRLKSKANAIAARFKPTNFSANTATHPLLVTTQPTPQHAQSQV